MKLPTILDSKTSAIKRIVIVVAEVLVAAAVLYGARQIIIKCILYGQGLRGPDSTLYFTMGNAIQSGLTIYRDVFDPKPPGIFLLSAGSLSLFGDGTLAEILNIIILLCIPIVVVWSAAELYLPRLRTSHTPHATRLCAALGRHSSAADGIHIFMRSGWFVCLQLSLVIGLMFTLYHATIGGDVQTEFYGAFFGLVYLAALAADQRRPRGVTLAIASLSAAISLLFKEPFALTLFAAALLLLRTRREWVRLWLVPMVAAGIAYIIVLAPLGALGSYVTIYLRAMFGNYILAGGGPVWARGLVAWERIFINVLDFSAWFPLLLAALFLLSLPRFEGRRGRFIGASVTGVCVAILLLVRSFFPAQFPWWQVGTGTALLLMSVALGALVMSVRSGGMSAFIRRTWRHGLALYLTLTAIGLGSGFHGQYFALALPVSLAFFLLILRRQSSVHPFSMSTILGCTALAAAILLTSTSFIRSPMTLGQMTTEIETHDNAGRGAAKRLDAILDACDINRYYFLEAEPLPYSTHSPLNYYLYTRIEHIGRFHPLFFDESFRRLGQAQIIVGTKPYTPSPRKGNAMEECLGKSVQSFVAKGFTSAPPTCAKNLPMPEGYRMLFKRDRRDDVELDILQCKFP